jgi:hypothetical protein
MEGSDGKATVLIAPAVQVLRRVRHTCKIANRSEYVTRFVNIIFLLNFIPQSRIVEQHIAIEIT